jgi:hypothetical protein
VRVELDGKVLSRAEQKRQPLVRRIVARIKQRERFVALCALLLITHPAFAGAKLATGILVLLMNNGFAPVLHVYTTGTAATETVPSGATTCIIEAWGSGGQGGQAHTGDPGGGGGAGGYCRTSFNAASNNGKTLTYTVGQPSGNNSTVADGTASGLATMTADGGGAGGVGSAGGAPGGTGGSASGGTQANTTGATGGSAGGSPGTGAAGTSGTVSNDGSPYGAGGNGSIIASNPPGGVGAVVFFYT